MPALPLGEAGAAAAYLVFLSLVLVYVGIIGSKVACMSASSSASMSLPGRTGGDRRPARHRRPHKTAPVALRERLAARGPRRPRARRPRGPRRDPRGRRHLHLQPHGALYLVAGDRVAAETEALGILARQADIPPTELLGASTPSTASTRCATSSASPPGSTP